MQIENNTIKSKNCQKVNRIISFKLIRFSEVLENAVFG